jgi:release factor glutamine methyltransferase
LITIAEAIAEGARLLDRSGVADARRTAGLLMEHFLGADRAQLLVRSSEHIDDALLESYIRLAERRASGEPVHYIIGHQEFFGLDFKVDRSVLIPRPETEFLVEQVIALARDLNACSQKGLMIVDAGTGSGCIAVSLAVNIPRASILAIDISPAALDVARLNARNHGVESRIEFIEGDMLSPLSGRGLDGAVDLLVSNPPYVPASSLHQLQREVRDWEPREALFGGEEGLDFYRRLLDEGKRYVKPGGSLVCEIGYSQLAAIRELIDLSAWQLTAVTSDLQGIPRTLSIRRL